MKHIILVNLILIIGCGFSNDEKDEFSGNWYACSHDGLYVELLIKTDSFKYSAGNGLITKYYHFKINVDTLIYSDSNLSEDSLFIKKAKIIFISADQITLDYITSDEHWIFYKLKDKIADIDNNEKLLIATQKRAKKYQCSDNRTIDEKAQDSIDRQIYFQF